MTADQIWQAALRELQLQMTKATFDTWVKNTRAISHEDGIFVIGVPNALARDWLENRLLTTV
nr:chromosomal replication initiator protein DnaA [Anaerolineae bacterium]